MKKLFKTSKKTLAIFLAVLMLLTAAPMAAFAAVDEVLNASGIELSGAVFEQETDRSDAYPWVIDNTTLGKPAIKTSNEGADSQMSLICFHVAGQGYLDIDYKASTEEGWDTLYFQADGKTVGQISGEVEDTIRIKLAGEGQSGLDYHRIFAYYLKDTADAAGSDAAWITGMRFTPVADLPAEAAINGTPYYSLSEAADVANASEEDCTIVLMSDVASSLVIDNSNGKKITLDLNGHVLTSVASNNIDVSTAFVLTDSKIDEGTGKYLSLHENAMYNSGNGAVTIRDVVIENTNMSGVKPTIIYNPKSSSPAVIEGDKTSITIVKDNANYCTNTSSNLSIKGGAFFSKNPSAYVKDFGLEVVTLKEGDTVIGYKVVNNISDDTWLYYADAAGLEIDGTTYTVKTAEGLAQIIYLVNSKTEYFSGKTIVLANDIDLAGKKWIPIGHSSYPFKGTFDGQGHTISNLVIDKQSDNIGFFGYITSATIKNVNFNNASVVSNEDCAGSGVVAGKAYDATTIKDVNVTGKIHVLGGQYVGGIAGNMSYADYYNCTVDGQNDENYESVLECTKELTSLGNASTNYVGGILGQPGEGKHTIDSCTVKNITIKALGYGAGGIAGVMQYGNVITNNEVKNVKFVSPAEESLAWTGSVVGKDYTNKKYAPAIVINNTVDYSAVVEGEETWLFYVGDDHSQTGTPFENYEANTIIGENVVYENGKVVSGTFTFIGPNAKEKAEATLLADTIVLSANDDGTFGAKIGGVAKIGNKGYASVNDALIEAQNGDTIILLENDTKPATVREDLKVTLDLNGFTMSNGDSDKATITNNGDLKIIDTTEARDGKVVNTVGKALVDNNGTLTIIAGIYNGEIAVADDAQCEIYGGTYTTGTAKNEAVLPYLASCHTLGETGKVTFTHKFKDKATVEPNCTERGYTIQVCEDCEAVRQTNYVAALGHKNDAGVEVKATCTTYGGTLYTCSVCGAETFEKDKYAAPTGHNMSDWYYVEYTDGFAKKRYCQNEGCTQSEFEKNGEEINVYYKVEFVNAFVSPKGDDGHYVEVDGTTVAKTDAYVTETLETQYVLKGSKAEFTGKTPVREKTKECGEYCFTGFSGSLDAVTANTVAEAQFEKTTRIYFVTFAKDNGTQYTIEQQVIHGTAAQYPFANPTKADDMYNHYEFDGWSRNGKVFATVSDTPIYSSGRFVEHYKKIPKNFKVIFCDIDKNGNEVEIGSTTGVHFGEAVANVPTDLTKATDATYRYEFSGKWKFANGEYANMKNLAFYANNLQEYDPANEDDATLSDAQKGIIRVYAEYFTQTVKYSFSLDVMDIDGYTPAADGTVQILDADHQFVALKKLDEDGHADVTLTYKPSYILQITCNGNVKELVLECYFLDGAKPYIRVIDGEIEGNILPCPWESSTMEAPVVAVTLEEDSVNHDGNTTAHSCICHTFLARPWLTILRLMNSLFGRKYVCCPDMYERHGNVYGD